MKILWLDDLRNPFLNKENKLPKEKGSIIWVLDYDQFVEWINVNGLPDVISFDHDLKAEHYTPEYYWNDYQASKEYQDNQNYKYETGRDCAKWLVNYCLQKDLPLPVYYVHSANPVGRDYIILELNKYKND